MGGPAPLGGLADGGRVPLGGGGPEPARRLPADKTGGPESEDRARSMRELADGTWVGGDCASFWIWARLDCGDDPARCFFPGGEKNAGDVGGPCIMFYIWDANSASDDRSGFDDAATKNARRGSHLGGHWGWGTELFSPKKCPKLDQNQVEVQQRNQSGGRNPAPVKLEHCSRASPLYSTV